jgi:thiamine biosynthesis lipoprotein
VYHGGVPPRSILTVAVVLLSLAPPSRPLHHHEASRVSMACTYAIDAYASDAAALPRAVEAALDEVDRIDRLMSHYKSDSELSRVNRDAGKRPVTVSPELFDFIDASLEYSRDSGGAFDVTVGPLMKAWGFFRGEGRVPDAAEMRPLKERIGFEHVLLNRRERTIAFDRDGVEIDLGGIAKGYAVDRAVGVMRRAGVGAALVSAGGSTIYGAGAPPGETGWEVILQDPIDARKTALTLRLNDRALSVAGSSEKSFESGGVRYSHIMDPRTARPVQGVLSVAVLAASGTAGDALDDAFFVEGLEKARAHVARLRDPEAYFFLPDRTSAWRMDRLTHAR